MTRPLKIILIILAAIVGIGAVTFIVSEAIVIHGSKGRDWEDADYIIVLGAKVDPWGPSRALEDRLKGALSYLEQYPDSKAVLTGGQGLDEVESEAACMARWLSERGVEPGRLLPEDQAADTRENLRLSCGLIEADCGQDWKTQKIVIVSSEYHLCRAAYLGKHLLGYAFGTYPAATSLPAYKTMYFIREALGMVYTTLFYI